MTPLDPPTVERFRTALAARFGLHFDDSRTALLDEVLSRRLAATGLAPTAYLDRLEQAASVESDAELGKLASELTVGETYFFRNHEQFQALAEAVVPERMSSRREQRTLRLLSAGCASGEEALTVAMILREQLPELAGWEVELRAVDVNPAALERARRGHYSSWSLRETPADQQRRWFRPGSGGFELDASVREMVTFARRTSPRTTRRYGSRATTT
jgi:chemotaxis protein methyltransferase CheR